MHIAARPIQMWQKFAYHYILLRRRSLNLPSGRNDTGIVRQRDINSPWQGK